MSAVISARQHSKLLSVWKEAESRHLTDDELQLYLEALPDFAERARAAREVRQHEGEVVNKAIQAVFSVYPYESNHEFATAKCTRDVRYVSAYATMAMLMADGQWLDDKLLIWLKTILQSFSFPDKVEKRSVLFGAKAQDASLERLDAKRRSIFDCYTRLRDGYQAALTPPSYQLMRPALQQVIDTLTEE